MMKRLIILCCAVILVLSCALPTLAHEGFTSDYYRLIDMAGLLDDAQYSDLLGQLDELSERQQFDVTIFTEESYSGYDGYDNVTDFADDAYDAFGFGYGENYDGVILVIVMDTHDLYLSTSGYGITVVTDAGREHLFDEIKGYFSSGDYYTGFSTFIALMDDYIDQAKSGEPYDIRNLPRDPFSKGWILISLVVGFIFALIVVNSMKAKLKTVRPALAAGKYVRENSMNITLSRDLFLYRNISRTKKSSSDSSSGGSSTHTSSSGNTHGGGGTKF